MMTALICSATRGSVTRDEITTAKLTARMAMSGPMMNTATSQTGLSSCRMTPAVAPNMGASPMNMAKPAQVPARRDGGG